MKKHLVYDLPLRIFHWLFAGLFVTSILIAKTLDDESPAYSYHMLAGLTLGFLVLLRVVWGFVGTKYSRFSSFALKPKELVTYFSRILSGEQLHWAGHNPASSWAAIIMFLLALGLGFTGYQMTNGHKETFEDIHELLANGFLVVVLMHIAGVALHSLRHRDNIGMSVIDGTKKNIPTNETISSSRPFVALLFVGLVVTFVFHLANSFDRQNQTLDFLGTTLHLGDDSDDARDID